jgi:Flp pilus assembly protein TadB
MELHSTDTRRQKTMTIQARANRTDFLARNASLMNRAKSAASESLMDTAERFAKRSQSSLDTVDASTHTVNASTEETTHKTAHKAMDIDRIFRFIVLTLASFAAIAVVALMLLGAYFLIVDLYGDASHAKVLADSAYASFFVAGVSRKTLFKALDETAIYDAKM